MISNIQQKPQSTRGLVLGRISNLPINHYFPYIIYTGHYRKHRDDYIEEIRFPILFISSFIPGKETHNYSPSEPTNTLGMPRNTNCANSQFLILIRGAIPSKHLKLKPQQVIAHATVEQQLSERKTPDTI